MANRKLIQVGDVIQVTDEKEVNWIGCLMIVGKVKNFGVEAYMKIPFKGNTSLRLRWEQFEIVGPAAYIKDNENE